MDKRKKRCQMMYKIWIKALVINSEKKLVALPTAVRQFSISPFICRSIALATSTLLYFEYLSNTEGEKECQFWDLTATNKKIREEEQQANLDADEGHSLWWGFQWRRSSLCPFSPPRPHTEPWHHCQSAAHWLPQSCQPVLRTNRAASQCCT